MRYSSQNIAAEHCRYISSSDKTIVSPQLRPVRTHPYTLEWRLFVVNTSRALAVRHETEQYMFVQVTFTEGRKVIAPGICNFRITCEQPTKQEGTKWSRGAAAVPWHQSTVNARWQKKFPFNNWEFETLIYVGTLTGMGRSDSSRKRSELLIFRCIPQSVVLARMFIWFIVYTRRTCLSRCASNRINRQICRFINALSNS
jgi:hypothetical protein